MDKRFVLLLLVSIGIKLFMGFLSHLLSFLNFFFYIVDCALLPMICMGLWFHFEESQRMYQISLGYWVIVFGVSFFGFSLFYYISTFFSHKKYKYNVYVGFALMLISTLITLKLVDHLWLNSPMIW